MYEYLIGTKVSRKVIFDTLIDLAALGEPDDSNYPAIYITVRHIGTVDEMSKLQSKLSKQNPYVCFVKGRRSRKGKEAINNSSYTLQDLVGKWDTSVTADGSMSNEMLVLSSDGTGAFAEANMGPYFETPISWYLEDDILTICTDGSTICHAHINYNRKVHIPCMGSKRKKFFTGLLGAAYGLNFYRDRLDKPLEERETEAAAAMAFLRCEKKEMLSFYSE